MINFSLVCCQNIFTFSMKTIICLFEDSGFANLLPLVYTRPVYDLNCGILSIREKIELHYPKAKTILHARNYLNNILDERYPNNRNFESITGVVTYINGRLIVDKNIVNKINILNIGEALVKDDYLVAVKLRYDDAQKYFQNEFNIAEFNISDFSIIELTDVRMIKYPWDLVNLNGNEIRNDFQHLQKKTSINIKLDKNVVVKNKKSVFIDKGTTINPFVIIDATNGPVYIGKSVEIMSHVTIQGPVCIGDNSVIKSHTSIYHDTSIGTVCKVGGEIENSIIHSYSNKQHEGFLGHSYLGSWINIGASTNNSDLKNNYSDVDVYINGRLIRSGSKFVGLIMGDHSKTAINTMFNTGTTVGVSSNIFGAGFPPKYIPSFCWGGSEWLRTYDISKCIEVAKIVMKRRNVELSENEERLLHTVFEMTSIERKD